MQKFLYAIMAVASIASVTAHMEIDYPPPLRSKFNSHSTNIDYSMTAPLSGEAQYPCKGYLSDLGTPAGASVVTWAAGSQHNFSVVGGAPHGGGSCQAALSYDKGATFKVIASYVGSCPLASGDKFDFTVPSDAPTGDAVFSWSWLNKIGNREFYQNCASVTIGAGSAKRAAGAASFSSLPDIFVANLGGGCATIENKDTVFPDPGPNVVGTATGSGTLTGSCGAVSGGSGDSTPASPPIAASPVASTESSTPTTLATAVATSKAVQATPVVIPGGVFATVPAVAAPKPTSSAIPASPEVPAVSPVAPVASVAPVAPVVPVAPAAPVEPVAPVASAAPVASVVPVAPAAPETPAAPASPAPPAAIPASPPASIGTGTPSNATGSQSGACTSEGMFNCISGTQFQQCASGIWSVVMPLSPGTKCSAGQSMSLDIGFASRARRNHRRHLSRHVRS